CFYQNFTIYTANQITVPRSPYVALLYSQVLVQFVATYPAHRGSTVVAGHLTGQIGQHTQQSYPPWLCSPVATRCSPVLSAVTGQITQCFERSIAQAHVSTGQSVLHRYLYHLNQSAYYRQSATVPAVLVSNLGC